MRARIPRMARLAMALVAVSLLSTWTAAVVNAGTQVWFPGRGWGHGIGMSQYGAKGFAEKGYTARQIIEYYYAGTSADNAATNPNYDVLLEDGRSVLELSVRSTGVTVRRGSSTVAGFEKNDIIRVENRSGKGCVYRVRAGTTSTVLGCGSGTILVVGAVATRFTADNGAYGNRYRGHLRFVTQGGTLAVINRVRLEDYLRGVVPAEMPTSWHAQALQAQAITARSYALATQKSGLYDANADTRSQMYLGINHETAASDAAIAATAGTVARAGGVIIPTFFHSTSGGRTASIEDVWSGAPRSYLKTRNDPYERSPYSRWDIREVRFGQGALRRKLGRRAIPGRIRAVRVATNRSRRAEQVRFVTNRGTRTVPATTVQSALGLRSTFFRVEVLELVSRARRARRGQRVTLQGRTPRGGRTYLVFRATSGGKWRRVTRIRPQRGNQFRVRVRIKETGAYRLHRRGQLGPGVRIRATG